MPAPYLCSPVSVNPAERFLREQTRVKRQGRGFMYPQQFTTLTAKPPWAVSFVFGLHVPSGVQHGADDLVQRDKMSARAAQGHAGGVDGLDGGDGVALNAGYLDEARNRITGEAQIVLHAYFRGVFHLVGCSPQVLPQERRRPWSRLRPLLPGSLRPRRKWRRFSCTGWRFPRR